MKKIVILLLVVAMLLPSLSSCKSQEKAEEYAQIAYENLVAASDICSQMGLALYTAWNFAIKESDKYATAFDLIEAFVSETKIQKDDLMAVFDEHKINSYSVFSILTDFNLTVPMVIETFELNKSNERLEEHISAAKEAMDTVLEQGDHISYSALKSMYVEVKSYALFLSDPEGLSLLQFDYEILTPYEKNIRDYKAALSLHLKEYNSPEQSENDINKNDNDSSLETSKSAFELLNEDEKTIFNALITNLTNVFEIPESVRITNVRSGYNPNWFAHIDSTLPKNQGSESKGTDVLILLTYLTSEEIKAELFSLQVENGSGKYNIPTNKKGALFLQNEGESFYTKAKLSFVSVDKLNNALAEYWEKKGH